MFEPLSSRLLIIEVELKPCLLCVFEKVKSIFKLGNKKSKVYVETKFEIEDGLELSTGNAIGAIGQTDLVLHEHFLSKFYN